MRIIPLFQTFFLEYHLVSSVMSEVPPEREREIHFTLKLKELNAFKLLYFVTLPSVMVVSLNAQKEFHNIIIHCGTGFD